MLISLHFSLGKTSFTQISKKEETLKKSIFYTWKAPLLKQLEVITAIFLCRKGNNLDSGKVACWQGSQSHVGAKEVKRLTFEGRSSMESEVDIHLNKAVFSYTEWTVKITSRNIKEWDGNFPLYSEYLNVKSDYLLI